MEVITYDRLEDHVKSADYREMRKMISAILGWASGLDLLTQHGIKEAFNAQLKRTDLELTSEMFKPSANKALQKFYPKWVKRNLLAVRRGEDPNMEMLDKAANVDMDKPVSKPGVGEDIAMEDMIKREDIIRFDKIQDPGVIAEPVARALHGSPLKGQSGQVAHMVGQIVAGNAKRMNQLALPPAQLAKVAQRIATTPRMRALMMASKDDVKRVATVFADVLVKQIEVQAMANHEPEAEEVQEWVDVSLLSSDRLVALLRKHGWTPQEAIQFGPSFLHSHGFTPKDVWDLESLAKMA